MAVRVVIKMSSFVLRSRRRSSRYACFSSCVAMVLLPSLTGLFQLPQYREQVLPEPLVVLGHREMADAFHLGELCSRDGRGGRLRLPGGANVIVFPGQEVDGAPDCVDLALAPAQVPI